MYTFSLLFLSGISSWVVATTLKLVFRTTRPFIEENIVPLYLETGFSFPSSHAAVFASIAVAMFAINKRVGVVLSIIAVFVGISRMVIGVHYPVDVGGGLLLGALVGYLFTKLFKKI
jgi:undecaprenyl-diphosphatase